MVADRNALPAAPEGVALKLMRKVDWARTGVGPPGRWPPALRIALSLILNSPEAMYLIWREDFTFLFNDAYAHILGSRLESAMGRSFREVWFDVWDQVGATVDAVFAGGAERFVDMPLAMAREGVPEDTFWTFSFSPVRDEDDRIVGLLCVTNEQTRRIETERRQRASNTALRAEVAQNRADLDRAEDQLRQSQKIEAIGQLTGGVAHDFNNLLTVIRGSVELLKRPDLPPERRERYLDAIGDTADRAAALTRQLLAFARRQALNPETFDLRQSLGEVTSLLATLVGSRIELRVDLPEEPVFVLADRSQLDTAVVNMALNARDAMDGAGKLKIAAGLVTGVPALRSHPPVPGDFVCISVSDTGVGIPPEQLGMIFEPFFTTKPMGAGTGLGLSQVFGFAKQSGGDLQVDSTVGEGTTFTLYLPRSASGAQPAAAPAGPAALQVASHDVCVLLVEDNASVGEFAADALKTLGYDCVLAADGESALRELEAGCDRFHVVFSDIVMPGIGGLEMARRIREAHPEIPVILTSGYSHVLAQEGHEGFELLHKPYSIEQLADVIRKAVARQAGAALG